MILMSLNLSKVERLTTALEEKDAKISELEHELLRLEWLLSEAEDIMYEIVDGNNFCDFCVFDLETCGNGQGNCCSSFKWDNY
jgi:Cys-tRNA synthase (O-phospho-L-seryl-tRNA:Cys-tRNA synthase)